MPFGDQLFQRLRMAKRDELEDLLRDLKLDPLAFSGAINEELVVEISKELRNAAGNSLRNIVRGAHDFPYKQLLVDASDKLAPGWKWTAFKVDGPETEEQIENYIYDRILDKLQEKLRSMSDRERADVQAKLETELAKKGFRQHTISAVSTAIATGTITSGLLGPVVAWAIFGGIWTWLFGLTLGQLLLGGLLVGGPAGVVIGTLSWLTGSSYSKTIPATVRLIHIRRCRVAEESLET